MILDRGDHFARERLSTQEGNGTSRTHSVMVVFVPNDLETHRVPAKIHRQERLSHIVVEESVGKTHCGGGGDELDGRGDTGGNRFKEGGNKGSNLRNHHEQRAYGLLQNGLRLFLQNVQVGGKHVGKSASNGLVVYDHRPLRMRTHQ